MLVQKDETQFQYDVFCKYNVVLIIPKTETERPVFASTDQEGGRVWKGGSVLYPELLHLARTDYVCTCSGAVISA